MKNFLFVFVLVCASNAVADDVFAPSAEDAPKSVLVNPPAPTPAPAPVAAPTPAAPAAAVAPAPAPTPVVVENAPKRLVYKNKRSIAPGAVQQGLNLSYCETCVDACCNKVSYKENLTVPACVPPCASKDEVSVSRDGKRVVHDYGRYEVVLKAKNDGDVEVRYRKRLLNR